jgi:hypothetical protein
MVEVVVIGTLSLHPNQPGVLHDDVELVLVDVEVEDSVYVDSSRQPNQPGVLQVSVLVRLDVEVEVTKVDVVVGSVPLLSKYSHG